MNEREAKKWRRGYRKQINAAAHSTLKKEIFRLARQRDILGLVVIGLCIALIVSVIIHFT